MSSLSPNIVIRPIRIEDADALFELSEASGIGFTSLPSNREFLKNKIQLSIDSFLSRPGKNSSQYYLLVAEECQAGKVIGCTAMAANIGCNDVFYSYKLGRLTKACPQLGVRIDHKTLTITTDYQGCSEVCTLFLLPEYRKNFGGQLLSRCRFLFMKAFASRFNAYVMAEMRGISDEKGHSPFWESIAKHFFGGVEFPQVDYLTGIGEKQFIADLMPEFRLYTCMLPQTAQAVIGEVHEKTKPALAMLKREGFRYRGYLDLFDGGPSLESRFENVFSIKKNRCAVVVELSDDNDGVDYIISNTNLDFHSCVGRLQVKQTGEMSLPAAVADCLQVAVGDKIRFIEVRKK